MSGTRTFLVCDSELHAECVDALVFLALQEHGPTGGGGWSGVWTDGQRFGILWEAPVSNLFGLPADFPELVLVEDTADEWTFAMPEAQPETMP
jgi:hypothetical protein